MALFAIGTEKFIVIGLLPNIANYFGVSLGDASKMVTYYVFGIAFSAPFTCMLLRKINEKYSLVLLMFTFILGNTIACFSTNYSMLLFGRVVASFTHAPFVGIATSFISKISDNAKKSSNVSLIFSGLTVANIIGVPFGTFIGNKYGWQATFAIIAIFGLLVMLMLVAFMKNNSDIQSSEEQKNSLSMLNEIKAILQRPSIILAFLITIVNFICLYFGITYLKVALLDYSKFSSTQVTYLLSLFGVGATFGALVGGIMYRSQISILNFTSSNMYWALIAIFAIMINGFFFSFFGYIKIIAITCVFFFGFLSFTLVPFIQSRVIEKSFGLSSFASVLHVASFNVGSGLGSMIAGMLVGGGFLVDKIPGLIFIPSIIGMIAIVFSVYLDGKKAILEENDLSLVEEV